jgi:hypothetical protein
MQHAHLVERVRQIVRDAFAERGVTSFDELCETILIRDGFYCGRCFTCGEFRAVWFLEENVIKFFCRESGLLFTRSASADEPAARLLAA